MILLKIKKFIRAHPRSRYGNLLNFSTLFPGVDPESPESSYVSFLHEAVLQI